MNDYNSLFYLNFVLGNILNNVKNNLLLKEKPDYNKEVY
jgi:hypothetical protein